MKKQAVQFLTKLTVKEFREYTKTNPESLEFIDGVIYAMAPPTARHTLIASRVSTSLSQQLGVRNRCNVLPETEVFIEKTGNHYKPDIMVSCDPQFDQDNYLLNPVVIFEVLSKSTGTIDKKIKVFNYVKIPSVTDIFLIEQSTMHVYHYKRITNSWDIRYYTSPDEVITIDSLNLTITLAEIYYNIDVG